MQREWPGVAIIMVQIIGLRISSGLFLSIQKK